MKSYTDLRAEMEDVDVAGGMGLEPLVVQVGVVVVVVMLVVVVMMRHDGAWAWSRWWCRWACAHGHGAAGGACGHARSGMGMGPLVACGRG